MLSLQRRGLVASDRPEISSYSSPSVSWPNERRNLPSVTCSSSNSQDSYDGPMTNRGGQRRGGYDEDEYGPSSRRYPPRPNVGGSGAKLQDSKPARRTKASLVNRPRDDPFASFKSYQQRAMLQAAGVGPGAVEAGMRPDLGWLPGPTPELRPILSRGWFARPEFTVQSLYDEILRRCEMKRFGSGPLFMMIKLAETREDARTVVDAIAAVRSSRARQGIVQSLDPRLSAGFPKMCFTCDAPDVLAEVLQRSNELGVMLSHNRVHEVLMAWGAALELHKIEQVVVHMERGGIPPNTKTAYIMIRSAVNCGRQEVAEQYARIMQQAGVRLHHSTLRLLETGRRSKQIQKVDPTANGAGSPDDTPSESSS